MGNYTILYTRPSLAIVRQEIGLPAEKPIMGKVMTGNHRQRIRPVVSRMVVKLTSRDACCIRIYNISFYYKYDGKCGTCVSLTCSTNNII